MATSIPEDIEEDSDQDGTISEFGNETNVSGTQKSSTVHNGSVSSTNEVKPDRYGFLGGKQYTQPELAHTIPAEIQRRRELKWLSMFYNWEKYMTKKYRKVENRFNLVRDRCRKGIPPSVRGRAWQHLCGATYLLDSNKHRFCELDSQPGDPRYVDEISKDLDRQFPFHEMFVNKEGHGQEDLFRVLKAYSILNPRDGYCQAQAPIAAVLLMHMPVEAAFWCLVSICDRYIPGYFSPGLEAIQLDGDILNGLLKRVSSSAYKQLKRQKVDPVMYMTEWFMCLFARTLPWGTVLRIWDIFFCEGVKTIFRVALVLLRSILTPDTIKKCPSMYETLEYLKNIHPYVTEPDLLIELCLKLPVAEYDLEKEHQKQVTKRRALRIQQQSLSNGTKTSKSKKTRSKSS
ncbi:TBC1 domain family member 10B [Nymphon striatum]|nr:TBC1 domain family member 10B [Nymphon striatum]